MKTKLSADEQFIIMQAVMNALAFGTGALTASQEELEDYGYTWTDEHEKFSFEFLTFAESGGEVIL